MDSSSSSIRTSSLALSLLRHSSLPSESFVLSPFSLNSSLSIVHDGADGKTRDELTTLLLGDCSPSQVTDFYSSLTLSLPSTKKHGVSFKLAKRFYSSLTLSFPSTKNQGVSFKLANRFYVDKKIPLKNEYQKDVEEKYNVKVENLNLTRKGDAAKKINKFVAGATNGKITDIVKPEEIDDGTVAILINAIHILAKWKHPFPRDEGHTGENIFYAENGKRKMFFMSQTGEFDVNQNNEIGTVLIMPYQDEKYTFFYLMPNESSNLETMRNSLTGESLVSVLKGAEELHCMITVPKFKVESDLDGVEVLKKLGVAEVFNPRVANLSKISNGNLYIGKIQHKAMIETDELGTEAAAVTDTEILLGSCLEQPPSIFINRPFLFGIRREENILFIGQFA